MMATDVVNARRIARAGARRILIPTLLDASPLQTTVDGVLAVVVGVW